jgi:hypothetical protein
MNFYKIYNKYNLKILTTLKKKMLEINCFNKLVFLLLKSYI